VNVDRIVENIDNLFDDNGYALDSTQALIIKTAIQDEIDFVQETLDITVRKVGGKP